MAAADTGIRDDERGIARAQRTLLAVCARDVALPEQARRIEQALACVPSWDGFLERAEAEGMGPLAQRHLDSPNVQLPAEIRRGLKGLALRHKRSHTLRREVVRRVARVLADERIDGLWLKGTALAETVYSEPGLRPMRDLDLLVAKDHAPRAQAALIAAGFVVDPASAQAVFPGHHHLPAVYWDMDGLRIEIEVHKSVFVRAQTSQLYYEELAPRAIEFRVVGAPELALRTLCREDMLWFVYRHGFCMPLHFEPFRLIWVADIVSLVERFLLELDWDRVRAEYPSLIRVLPLLSALVPWDARVVATLGLPEVTRARVGDTFDGAPYTKLPALLAERGPRAAFESTFLPSPWWLSLHYGAGASEPRLIASYLRHAYEVLRSF